MRSVLLIVQQSVDYDSYLAVALVMGYLPSVGVFGMEPREGPKKGSHTGFS